MLKLMKYEFRKQLFTKFVMLGGIFLLELYFLYGVILKDNNKIGIATGLLVFAAVVIFSFVAFESILTFHRDLKTKQSYMLFLVPKSTYTIVGAKVASAFLQMVFVALAFIVITALDFTILVARSGGFKEVVEMVKTFLNEIMNINVRVDILILLFLVAVLQWFVFLTIAMLSITLSNTFLANSRWKGVISVILFLVINYVCTRILGAIMPNVMDLTVGYLLLTCLYSFIEVAIAYFVTSWMLDKKVSV